jgi:hypothetical protein
LPAQHIADVNAWQAALTAPNRYAHHGGNGGFRSWEPDGNGTRDYLDAVTHQFYPQRDDSSVGAPYDLG